MTRHIGWVGRAVLGLLVAPSSEIAQRLDTDAETTAKWRGRWLAATPRLSLAESEGLTEKDLRALIEATLSDDPRPGPPDTFTPEQLVQVVAVACEDPRDSAREISHWTARELAEEVMQREIVETISARYVGRVLEEMELQPHRSRYWLTNEREQDPAALDAQMKTICNLYVAAPTLEQQGRHPSFGAQAPHSTDATGTGRVTRVRV